MWQGKVRAKLPSLGKFTCKYLIFRKTKKWRMEPACTTNMDIASLEIFAREHTTKKRVIGLMGAKGQNFATKDTLKPVKDTMQKKDANLEVIVLTNIQKSL